jgi:Uma2 family endonuclease
MNVQTASLTMITEVEYLEGERLSDIRHEYLAGQVYAMAGTSKVHNLIAGNLYSIIRSHITGKSCQAFMSDMKVRLADQNTYYYPDVVVTCSDMDIGPESPQYYLEDPLLIVEVLSPSTETIDRREKMLGYRSLPGLKEYVLIDSEKQWIEVYGRQNGANWTVDLFTPISPLILKSLDIKISLNEIYRDSGVITDNSERVKLQVDRFPS